MRDVIFDCIINCHPEGLESLLSSFGHRSQPSWELRSFPALLQEFEFFFPDVCLGVLLGFEKIAKNDAHPVCMGSPE